MGFKFTIKQLKNSSLSGAMHCHMLCLYFQLQSSQVSKSGRWLKSYAGRNILQISMLAFGKFIISHAGNCYSDQNDVVLSCVCFRM
jgi:hypothetical protein